MSPSRLAATTFAATGATSKIASMTSKIAKAHSTLLAKAVLLPSEIANTHCPGRSAFAFDEGYEFERNRTWGGAAC